MARVPFVAILALVVSGASAVACTNSPGDFGGGGSVGASSRRPRESNAGSGDIGGNPETPNEETLNGAEPGDDPENDPAPADDETDPAPPPGSSPDAGTPPPPPDPEPDPIPPGSFDVGTELVTTANLNIREGADTTYAIITTAPNGSRVTVVSVSGASGWVNIMWDGNVGWSSKAYLTVP